MPFNREPTKTNARERRNANQLAALSDISLPDDANATVSVTTFAEAQAAIRAQAAIINSLLDALEKGGVGKQ